MTGYARLVQPALARLVILIAVLLMPFGMTPAPAAAHGQSMAGMPMGHCDGAPEHSAKGGLGECTMACSAALPAAAETCQDAPIYVSMPPRAAAEEVLHGLHPDTATPPPKAS